MTPEGTVGMQLAACCPADSASSLPLPRNASSSLFQHFATDSICSCTFVASHLPLSRPLPFELCVSRRLLVIALFPCIVAPIVFVEPASDIYCRGIAHC